MIINCIRLLGYRWAARRLPRAVADDPSRSRIGSAPAEYAPHRLDPLEPRVLLSVDPLLMIATSPVDPPVIEVANLQIGQGFQVSGTTSSGPTIAFAGASGGASGNAPGPSLTPFGSDFRDGSEFLIGDISVNVVLFESDGSIDANTENWNQTRINQVKSEITEGLNWWETTFALQNSLHNLDFQIDFTFADNPVATGYEPIKHPQSDERLWIDDFLDQVGYNTSSSIFTDLDLWNHAQRVAKGTDWAFTIFVADSLGDVDGKFSDGRFAYAYLGGPFLMMTYDNDGWGINRMGQVLAHETAHIFYALDEYPVSSSYNDSSGYYLTQNLNAFDGHPNPSSRVDSLMAESPKQDRAYRNHTSSPSSLAMVGWQDSDGDGIFDVLDVPLTLTGTGSFDSNTNLYTFSGNSSVHTLKNLNNRVARPARHDITINTVDLIQYRVDNGQWIDGNVYGLFDTPVAGDVLITAPGTHTLEFRTLVQQTGLASNTWSDTVTVASAPTILVGEVSNPATTEAGGIATFEVVLGSAPFADVMIPIASSDTNEGTVSTGSLLFTAGNWNVAQTVTVTGVDDAVADGDAAYTVLIGPATSGDTGYNGLDPADVALTNTDDDTPGITVTPTSSPITTEAGGVATFEVVLGSQPLSDVMIPIASSDTSEGTVSTGSLLFTAGNWNVAQMVTVTGVDDAVADGDAAYTVLIGPATSSDTGYNGLDPADVALTNTDNDVVPQPSLAINFNEFQIESYGGRRADRGTASVSADGSTLTLGGDAWKKITLPYGVTMDTVIEFDFLSDAEGDIQGIGLDNNNSITSSQVFKSHGTENWGVAGFGGYVTGQGWKHYVINVGEYMSGQQMAYLTFANDHDLSPQDASSQFANVVVRENAPLMAQVAVPPQRSPQQAVPLEPSHLEPGNLLRAGDTAGDAQYRSKLTTAWLLGRHRSRFDTMKSPAASQRRTDFLKTGVLRPFDHASRSNPRPWERLTGRFRLSLYNDADGV